MLPIMLAEIWQWTPLMFLLLLTGLMGMPENQLRAAAALGARPAHLLQDRTALAPAGDRHRRDHSRDRDLQDLRPVYILTRGQPGGATETISMFMYNGAFVYFRMGYIAAAALIVLAIVASISTVLAAG